MVGNKKRATHLSQVLTMQAPAQPAEVYRRMRLRVRSDRDKAYRETIEKGLSNVAVNLIS